MTFDPSARPGAFEDRKPISAQDVLELRARVWSDGSVSSEEVDNLFALNRTANICSPKASRVAMSRWTEPTG